MKYFVLILLAVGFIPTISATCEDNQIDINSASLEKLDELTGLVQLMLGELLRVDLLLLLKI